MAARLGFDLSEPLPDLEREHRVELGQPRLQRARVSAAASATSAASARRRTAASSTLTLASHDVLPRACRGKMRGFGRA